MRVDHPAHGIGSQTSPFALLLVPSRLLAEATSPYLLRGPKKRKTKKSTQKIFRLKRRHGRCKLGMKGGEASARVMAEDARSNPPQAANEPPDKADEGGVDGDTERGRLEEAARRTRAKANRYAARLLGDGLEGEEILEDVLQSAVAAASHSKIERPEGYLFRGVVRRIHDLLLRKAPVEYVGSAPDLDALSLVRGRGSGHEIERNLLIQEIIALMDEETREVHFRRTRGDRWSSIAADLGITKAAAEERFRYGIEKVRARVLGSGRAKEAGRAQSGNARSTGTSRARRV